MNGHEDKRITSAPDYYRQVTAPHIVQCRKPHDCAWCGMLIQANSKAISYAYAVYESPPRRRWMHADCFAAMTEASDWRKEIHINEWMPGDFQRGSSEPSQ